MDRLIDTIRNIGIAKMGGAFATVAVVIVFGIFMLVRFGSETSTVLFSGLDLQTSRAVQEQLALGGNFYQTFDGGAEIRVRPENLDRLRLELAELGLGGQLVGYEIFDESQGFGTSSFVQNINRLRALEGELSRTISSLRGVKTARVHLVLPERKLFSRKQQKPTASVVLRMAMVARLNDEQVRAIRVLVSTAVSGLDPNQISVVDDKGELLASGGDKAQVYGEAFSTTDKLRVNFEERMRSRIESLLESVLGPGRARVEVQAEMNFDEVVLNAESYDPDGQVLRSTETIEELNTLENGLNDQVSIDQNLPNQLSPFGTAEKTSESMQRTEERNNFEISKSVRSTVVAPGQLRRMSVAVLVDGVYDRGSGGTLDYRNRTEDEMAQLEELVSTALGVSADRGDEFSIVNIRFQELPTDVVEEEAKLFGIINAEQVGRLTQFAIMFVVGFLVVILVVRPLLVKMFETIPVALPGQISGQMVRSSDGSVVYVNPDTGEQSDVPFNDNGTPMSLEEMEGMSGMDAGGSGGSGGGNEIDIEALEGKVRTSSAKKVAQLVEKHPEETVAILRGWIYQDKY